jgi:fibronectin-binding autotransporter adhesin
MAVLYWYIKLPYKGDTMGLNRRTRPLVGYGLDNALQSLAPQPIIAQRAPTTSDTAEIGTIWVDQPANTAYLLTSIANALANWQLIESSGGTGVFCDLTVSGTCGGTTIHGLTNNILLDTTTGNISITPGTDADLNLGVTNECSIAIGNADALTNVFIEGGTGANAILISAVGGTATLNNGGGTGTVNISTDVGASALNLGTGAAAKTVALGSVNTTSTTTVQSGTGGVNIASGATTPGLVKITPDTTSVASPTATATLNSRVLSVTFTGFTTASSGTQAFTIVSSAILATSALFVTVTCPTTGAALTVTGVQQLVGSVVVNTTNNGASAVAGNVIVNVWVLN